MSVKAKSDRRGVIDLTRKQRELEQRRQEVARHYRAGATQTMIAAWLGISEVTVRRDLKVFRERSRNAALRSFDRLRRKQLAKLAATERRLWEQWKRSIQDQGRGNPRYMHLLLKAIERRCRLLGLDAQRKDRVGTRPSRQYG